MDVTIEGEGDGDRLVKLQSDSLELNFRASREDLIRLRPIREARWENRDSIAVGRSANASVFWCCNGETVSLLVGTDDETWDIGVTIPLETVDTIVSLAESQGQ